MKKFLKKLLSGSKDMEFWDTILGQNDPFAPAGTTFGIFVHIPSSLFQISYIPPSFQISSHLDIMTAV